MIDKQIHSLEEAVNDIEDGATIMVGGFGHAGQPYNLLDALKRHNPRNLTLISNNAGNGNYGIASLLQAGCISKIICSFPRQNDSWAFDELYRKGTVELELVPQGNLVARIQAGGAGLGGIFTPTGYGTELAKNKEIREIDGKKYIFELPLKADFSLIKARAGDRWGNLVYEKTGRNFGPIMAAAAQCTIAEVNHIAPLGSIDPESVITPGIFVHRLVHRMSTERLSA